jgi:hypothetical protein
MSTDLPALSAPDVRKEWALPATNSETTVVGSTPASRATTVAPAAHPEKTKRETFQVPDKRETLTIDSVFSDNRSESSDDSDDDDDGDRGLPASKKLGSKPKASTLDQYKDWDNGEPLTTEQRQSIMALKSNYERFRAMNQLRNQRRLKELDLKAAAESALDGRKDQKRKQPGKQKGKGKESSKPVDKPAKPTSNTNVTGG